MRGATADDPTTAERRMRGDRRCRCAKCGRHFTTVGNFDRHQRVTKGGDVVCRDPAERGMVVRWSGGHAWWSLPGRED
jgi:hypothetical protein